jgi:polysaccharide biosynthesis protein PslG
VVALAGWRVPEARAVDPLLLGTHSHILWADGYPSVSTVMSWPESKVVRLDVGWWNFEAGSAADFPNSSWHAKLDAAISAATQRGKKIIVVDLHTPNWASSNPSASDYNLWAPADPAYYGDFMGRMALRYKGRVYGWELRNEPNHMGYFKAGDNSVGARAHAFGQMVIAAFPKIRAADPAAKIITGGISECDAPFIDAVYGSDGRFASSYDAVGLHPFSWNRAPDRSYPDSPETVDFPRGTAAVRAVIDRYKANTRLWFTECGWQTSPVRREPWLSGVSESVQADYTRRLLAYVRAHTELKVDAVIAYNDKDLSSKPTGNKFDQSGLRRYNSKTKPAAAALA